MSRVDFYHLQMQNLEQVLPKLLEKAYGTGQTVLVKVGNEERVEFLNAQLWTYNDTSFIPHGSKKDGFGDQQPIWLTSDNDNPNNAQLLFLVDGASSSLDELSKFKRIFNIFDGNNQSSVEKARLFWKELKAADGMETYYWKQDENGLWTQAG